MANSTIFDDVFRTMLEKMPQLIIPLINEVFGTDYPGDIPIVQRRNEHYTRKGAIITDSHLFIADKIYHIECQSTSDSTMVIRIFGEISEMSGLPLDKVRELWEKKNGYEYSDRQALELESERLLREGRKVGREEGRAAGMVESSCASAIRMLQTGKYAIEEISRISGLTMEKIAEIKKAKNL